MRICFIADAGSIHVKRIVSYYVNQEDEVLVLSTATTRAEIPGSQVVHLIADKKSLVSIAGGDASTAGLLPYWKTFIPRAVKGFLRRSIRDVRVLHSRELCADRIARFDPDVVYCNRSFPEGVLAARCRVQPLLLRTAGPDISKLPKYPVYRQLISAALRSPTVIVTQSLWERDWLWKLCGNGLRVEVNLIGIDVDRFRPGPTQTHVRSRYDLPADAFVVVSNRYLNDHYNGWYVVEVIESLLESCPKLHLLYVHPLKLDARSKGIADAITRRSPRIRFLEGPVAHCEMPDILNCGDVYVSFSSYDGIPNSVLEAMACGLVPVVADLPQLREWIEDGVDGYVLPQKDTKALASMVAQLYRHRDHLPTMAHRCVEKIRARAAYESCSQRTRKLLESIARKPTKETAVTCSSGSRQF